MEGPSKRPFLPADMRGTRQTSPHVQELNTAKGSAQTLEANKTRCFRSGKGLVNKHHYLASNLPFSSTLRCGQEQRDRCFCLHMRVHVSPTSLLLPTQADRFHVKWAVINRVISLHQLYPDKSPKSNTKKKGLALETSVKAILDHRCN